MDKFANVITELRAWGSGAKQPPSVFIGLCSNLRILLAREELYTGVGVTDVVTEAAQGWEHHSGVARYPVPATRENPGRNAAIKAYNAADNLWESSVYGDLRRELCLHIANWFEHSPDRAMRFLQEGNSDD